MPRGRKKAEQHDEAKAKAYRHAEAESPLRLDIGTGAHQRDRSVGSIIFLAHGV